MSKSTSKRDVKKPARAAHSKRAASSDGKGPSRRSNASAARDDRPQGRKERDGSAGSGERGSRTARAGSKRDASASLRLLSGGNPQIPKGDGDGPVQAYLAAIPGWKRDVARRLDALIVRTVPDVRKAVRWNSPFYGVEGRGWFLAYHCFDRYLKVTFFRGVELDPAPPVASKLKHVRYFHIYEDDAGVEAQMTEWIRQAAKLPGEACF